MESLLTSLLGRPIILFATFYHGRKRKWGPSLFNVRKRPFLIEGELQKRDFC